MKLTSILAIYFLFWMFSLFLVLPFSIRTTEELGEKPVPGQAESGAHQFPARQVLLRTTLVSAALFALYYLNYVNGWVTMASLDPFGR